MRYLASLTCVLGLLGGCATVGPDDEGAADEQDVSTTYVNLMDFPKVDQGHWYDVIHALNAGFDQVCGDTFCEGDWSNITPLTFGCSVTSKLGNVKDCAWTFAASDVVVDPRTAAVLSNAPTFQCHITAKTTAVKLVAALSGSDPLHATLPGAPAATPTIYDQLGDCFEHPIGATPPVLATTGTASYVAGSDYYTTATGQAKWAAATAALKLGFDNVCGDTFCGSDFGDLQAMQLECAVTKSTGNVKGCAWVFAGSYDYVPAPGPLQVTSKSWTCPIAVSGTTLPKFLAALTATGTDDAIHRVVPGLATSFYDQIAGCVAR